MLANKKSPSLANIKVLERSFHNWGRNPLMFVRLNDGTIICAFKQGGMNLWAFPERNQYDSFWLSLFDRKMNELWQDK